MNKRHAHIAVTAGLTALLTLGGGASLALAEELETDPAVELMSDEASSDTGISTLGLYADEPGYEGEIGETVGFFELPNTTDEVRNPDGSVEGIISGVKGYIDQLQADLGYFEYRVVDEGNNSARWVYVYVSEDDYSVTWKLEDGTVVKNVNDLPYGSYHLVGEVESLNPILNSVVPEVTVNVVDASKLVYNDSDDNFFQRSVFTGSEDYLWSRTDTVRCFYMDGQYFELPIEWSEPAEGAFDHAGFVDIEGTIPGTEHTVVQRYEVYEATEVSAQDFWIYDLYDPESYYPSPELTITGIGPEGQQAELFLGASNYSWDNLPDSLTAGDVYELFGTVWCGDKSFEISCELSVYASPTSIEDFNAENYDTWVTPGEAPVLGEWISSKSPIDDDSEYSFGESFPIRWDWIDPSLYAEGKANTSFTVEGEILSRYNGAGLGITVSSTIHVLEVSQLLAPEVTTMPGVVPEIPWQVEAITSDGVTRTFYTNLMDIPEELYSTPGNTYTHEVTMYELATGNQAVIKEFVVPVVVHVTDEAGSVVDGEPIDQLLDLKTEQGSIPELPDTVPVELDNGTIIPAPVNWGEVSPDQFATPGSVVEITGTVQNAEAASESEISLAAVNIGDTVVARVQVLPEGSGPVPSFAEVDYSFVASGSGLNINDPNFGHGSVSVTMSDGSTCLYSVEWDDTDLDVNNPGTYLVPGEVSITTAAGQSEMMTVYMYVNVTGEEGPDQPGSDEPGTDEPGTEDPGTDQPGTDDPSSDDPSDPSSPSNPSDNPSDHIQAPVEVSDGGSATVTAAAPGEVAIITPVPEEGQEVRDVTVLDSEANIVDVTAGDDGTWSFVMPEGGAVVAVTFGCDGGDLCVAHTFPDFDSSQWYHDSIDWALTNDVMNGYADGTFGADDPLNREMAAAVLWNYLGDGDDSAPETTLVDVLQGEWYSTAVNWAVENGIMNGYEGAGFGIGDPLTREQFAAVVANAVNADVDAVDPSVLSVFPDQDGVSDWATGVMAWAVDAGIMNGVVMPDGSRALQADRDITRGEMAAMMINAVESGVLQK